MDSIHKKLTDLNQLIQSGKILEALEKYYHPEVVMQENESQPTIGKDANKKREEVFLDNIIEFRGAEVKGITIGNNLSSVIWSFDYTHKEWGKRKYTQVSVQHWKDGLIAKEQFFYGS